MPIEMHDEVAYGSNAYYCQSTCSARQRTVHSAIP